MNKKLKIIFEKLNREYWGGKLPLINLVISGTLSEDTLGEYFFPKNKDEDCYDNYCIKLSNQLSKSEIRDTLLHEMVHHSQFLKHKQKYWKKRLSWHGKFWKEEMRRVGFKGKINRYT
tara:strand:+ start:303 stop:656 length:354 start_codon:yes stop_codon:yes gene_type:complete